jgi:hypothetical protein
LASLNDAAKMQELVVVQVYFPDATYGECGTGESYSQLLGARAAAETEGTPEAGGTLEAGDETA